MRTYRNGKWDSFLEALVVVSALAEAILAIGTMVMPIGQMV